jgi:hypothetical protein
VRQRKKRQTSTSPHMVWLYPTGFQVLGQMRTRATVSPGGASTALPSPLPLPPSLPPLIPASNPAPLSRTST